MVVFTSEVGPIINDLSPAGLFAGARQSFVATGSGLQSATVSVANPLLIVDQVDAQDAQITFDIIAHLDSDLGATDVVFTTGLGSVIREIEVFPAIPDILRVRPAPLVLSLAQPPATLELRLSQPLATNLLLNVTTGNS